MKVAIFGAGTMGSGIAQVFAAKGHTALMYASSPASAQKHKDKLAASLAKRVAKGKMTQEAVDALLANILVEEKSACAGADLIIECVKEDMATKKELLSELDGICKDDAIFATNTSSLSITEMGLGLKHPVIGMHFFNPVPSMKLVEIINAYIAANYASYTKPIFLAGDFNESNMSSEMMVKLKEKWEIISTSSNTFMNTATPKRIDYIVLYKGNKAACEVLGTAVPSYDEINVNKVSDHLPVLVDIKK